MATRVQLSSELLVSASLSLGAARDAMEVEDAGVVSAFRSLSTSLSFGAAGEVVELDSALLSNPCGLLLHHDNWSHTMKVVIIVISNESGNYLAAN